MNEAPRKNVSLGFFLFACAVIVFGLTAIIRGEVPIDLTYARGVHVRVAGVMLVGWGVFVVVYALFKRRSP